MDFSYRRGDAETSVRLEAGEAGTWLARIADQTYEVRLLHRLEGGMILLIDGKRVQAYTAAHTSSAGTEHHFVAITDRETRVYDLEKPGPAARRTRRAGASGGGGLEAQMPGQVMEVLVSVGDRVERGQTLLILEAMKMEMRVTAPVDGVVSAVLVKAGETVDRGQPLAEVRSGDEGGLG